MDVYGCVCVCVFRGVYAWMCMVVCVCVCLEGCMHGCVWLCVCACAWRWVFACMYVCLCVCLWVCLLVNVCTCVVCVCLHAQDVAFISEYVCVCVCVCVCVHVCMCVCACACVCVCGGGGGACMCVWGVWILLGVIFAVYLCVSVCLFLGKPYLFSFSGWRGSGNSWHRAIARAGRTTTTWHCQQYWTDSNVSIYC